MSFSVFSSGRSVSVPQENLCKSRLETHDKTVVVGKRYFFVKPLLTGNTCGIIYQYNFAYFWRGDNIRSQSCGKVVLRYGVIAEREEK